jgi:Ca2+-binding RTX toxin-like protein
MTDLAKAHLKLAKYKALVDTAGLDTDSIANDVHLSNNPTSPGWGATTSGNDFIWFETSLADASVSGGGGNDIFVATSTGKVQFYGGTGSDTVAYVNATQGATIGLGVNGYLNAGAAAKHTYDSIENAVGSNYADVIVGNSSANKLFGNGGNDTIDGKGGNDTLNGGAGQDTFVGLLSGTVTVTGGADRDKFDFRVGGSDFDLTVTDFEPFFYNGNTQVAPSQATARNDMTHEFFHLSFDPGSGADTAQEVYDSVHFDHYVEHADGTIDAVWEVYAPNAHGTITFEGVLDASNPLTDVFTIYFDPLPVF